MLTVSIKTLDESSKKWQYVDMFRLKSPDIAREILTGFDGKNAVGEISNGEKTVYMCGTPEWEERMKMKGKVITFTKALEFMQARGYLDQIIAFVTNQKLNIVVDCFPDTPMTKVQIP